MNKKIYVGIITILVCFLLITGTYTVVHYYFNYSTDEWFRESIEDGNYVIVGEEIESLASIFGGYTQVEISIFDNINHANMPCFKTKIANNGEKLTSDNYKILYNEEYIKIVLISSDEQTSTYTFFFEDFN